MASTNDVSIFVEKDMASARVLCQHCKTELGVVVLRSGFDVLPDNVIQARVLAIADQHLPACAGHREPPSTKKP